MKMDIKTKLLCFIAKSTTKKIFYYIKLSIYRVFVATTVHIQQSVQAHSALTYCNLNLSIHFNLQGNHFSFLFEVYWLHSGLPIPSCNSRHSFPRQQIQ